MLQSNRANLKESTPKCGFPPLSPHGCQTPSGSNNPRRQENTNALSKIGKPSKMTEKLQRADNSNDTSEEIALAKRKRRMERNREAAAASRERKRHYVKSLEVSVKELREANEIMERELILLRGYVNFVQPYISKFQDQVTDGKGMTDAMALALQQIKQLRQLKPQTVEYTPMDKNHYHVGANSSDTAKSEKETNSREKEM